MTTPEIPVDRSHGNAPPLLDATSGLAQTSTADSESLQPAPHVAEERSPELRVRPYSLVDLPTMIRKPGMIRLDLPDSLVYPRPGFADLTAALPILRRDRPAFVATADGEAVGFVRFSPRRPDGRWVVTAIAASTGVYSPEPVWETLLAHGIRAAGLRGVRRLFARVPVGQTLGHTMRQCGWAPYATESMFRADRLAAVSRSHREVRLQEQADTWAIHQLYAASVPRQIQEIEAFTSHVWHMDQPRRTRRGARQTGWLLEEKGQLLAYARYTRGPRSAMIDAVAPPGQSAHFGAILDGIIAFSRQEGARPTYCTLRGYQLELRGELTDRGFSELGEQELFIRYTTVTARTPATDPVHFPVELRPAMPRRVPTFLESQPTDGTI